MEATTTRAEINEFLAHKCMAVIGVSRDSKEFANMLFRDLRQCGYNVIPVNPKAETLEGERCFARVQDIQPTPEAALVLTSPAMSEQVVRDCAEAGIKSIWLYGVGGPSVVNPAAVEFARAHGMNIIPGYCVYMFLPNAAFQHRVHSWIARHTGGAPN